MSETKEGFRIPEWSELLRIFPISLWAVAIAGGGAWAAVVMLRLGFDAGLGCKP